MTKYRIITNGRAFKVQFRMWFIWRTINKKFDTKNGATQLIEHLIRIDEDERVKWTVVDDKLEKK